MTANAHTARRLPAAFVAASVTLAIVATSRSWGHMRVIGRLDGELRDHLWVAWMVGERLRHGAIPLTFPEAGFPQGIALYPLDPLHQGAIAIVGAVVGLLPAVGLVATALYALTGIGAGRLALALGSSRSGAVIAAMAAMLGPPILGPFSDTQTEGMGAGWVLLMVSELAASRPSGWRAALFGMAVVASSPYLAHVVGPVAVVVYVARRLPWAPALTVAVVSAALFAAFLHAEGGEHGRIAARAIRADHPPISATSDVLPRAVVQTAVTRAVAPYPSPTETGPRKWAGWAMPCAALLAMVAAFVRRHKRTLVVAAAALACASLAVGSGQAHGMTFPYDAFWRWFPGGNLAWKPSQYGVPAWGLAAAVLATLPTLPAVLSLALIAAETQLRGPTPLPLPATLLAPRAAWTALATEPDGGLIQFPARARAPDRPLPADELLGPLFHHRPLGETFDRGRNRIHIELLEALAAAAGLRADRRAPPLPRALAYVGHEGFRVLLVHTDLLGETPSARLELALSALVPTIQRWPDGTIAYRLSP